jgi:hypothetical protein
MVYDYGNIQLKEHIFFITFILWFPVTKQLQKYLILFGAAFVWHLALPHLKISYATPLSHAPPQRICSALKDMLVHSLT